MRTLLLLFLLIPAVVLSGQYEQVDSLKNQIIETTPDATRARIYRQLCAAYRFIDVDTSLMYGAEALRLARLSRENLEEVYISHLLGNIQVEIGQVEAGMELLQDGLMTSELMGDPRLMIQMTSAIGGGYWRKKQNGDALQYFQRAHKWALQLADKDLLMSTFNNLGIISSDIGRSEEAIRYFLAEERIAEELNDIASMATVNLNVGFEYREMGKYEKALKRFGKAIPLFEQAKDYRGLALGYSNQGKTLLDLQQYREAIQSIDQGIELCERYTLKEEMLYCLRNKTRGILEMGYGKEAILLAQRGLDLGEEINYRKIQHEFYEFLAKAHLIEKQYEQAFQWQQACMVLKDSLHDLSLQKEVAQLEISFQTRQKDAENKLLKQESENQGLVIRQRTRLSIATLFAIVLLLALAFQLFKTRQQTKNMNRELEAKVKSRTQELEGLNEQLSKSNEELQRFASIASHDLKEPLRNMGGFISLIKRRLQKYDDDSLMEYLGFVERSNHQMVDLVNNVLEFSRLESFKQSNRKQIDLNTVVSDIEVLLAETIKNRKVQIQYDQLPAVVSHASMIRIVLKNLIENGIKYNKSDEPVIRIEHEADDQQLRLRVIDNGIGIDPEYHEKIFEMFARLHHRGEYKGSGMGLAFCRKILQNNGGDIRVESRQGSGSIFTICLPIATTRNNVSSFSTRILAESNSTKQENPIAE
ncbi:MAG: ATP-binding protein [Bacteroidota bacterium]